jgi:tetratricopeptide (TPR) repeat protein
VWESAAVGALCAVHPLRVEPAAWISGRADLLAALFGALALYAWAGFLRRRGRAWAALALAAFLLGLLSKLTVAALPFLLLVLDWWPLGRMRPRGGGGPAARAPGRGPAGGLAALLGEKAALFLLTAAMVGVTFLIIHRGPMVVTAREYPLPARAATSLISYGFYVVKTFWPTGLAVFYPHRWGAFDWRELLGSALLLTAVSAAALATARRRPYLLAGWLWFLGVLFPVIGLYQARQYPVADRYGYLPQVGLFLMVAWCLGDWRRSRGPGRTLAPAVAVALVLACVPVSRAQVRHWKDEVSLFSHAVAVAPDSALSHYNLGLAYLALGRDEEAAAANRRALALEPGDALASNNLGVACSNLGRRTEAIAAFRESVRYDPGCAGCYQNLGQEYAALGRWREAAAAFTESLRLDPSNAQVRAALGRAREALR